MRKNTCKRDFFLNQPCRKCINSSFFVDTKKKEKKKKKKNCTKSNVSLQIQSNNEKKILHLIEASFKNYKKGNSTDH